MWGIGLILETFNQSLNLREAHTVHGLSVSAGRHVALLDFEPLISGMIHLLVEEQAVETLVLIVRGLAV